MLRNDILLNFVAGALKLNKLPTEIVSFVKFQKRAFCFVDFKNIRLETMPIWHFFRCLIKNKVVSFKLNKLLLYFEYYCLFETKSFDHDYSLKIFKENQVEASFPFQIKFFAINHQNFYLKIFLKLLCTFYGR